MSDAVVIIDNSPVPVFVSGAPGSGIPGPAGPPGSGGNLIGLFTAAGSATIDSSVNLVQTTGYSTVGRGAALYVYDAVVDAAFVTARPRAAFMNGSRGFRLAERVITDKMFGSVDATGEPREATEAVTDCSDALDAMFAWQKYMIATRNIGVTMDLSGCQGLGVSRQWLLDTGDTGAHWNAPRFKIKPGRLVAMAAINGAIVKIKGHCFDVEGAWQTYGGTDTILNAGYGSLLAKYGVEVEDSGGSVIGDVLANGVRRYALKLSDAGGTNNIPLDIGYVKAIQCGNYGTGTKRFNGTYTGTWTSQPANNGSAAQRHAMVLTPETGADPNDIEVGDLIQFNSVSVGKVMAKGAVTSTTVAVDIYPWQSVESGGTFQSMHGGGAALLGDNIANTVIRGIQTYVCGGGIQVNALFCPKIGTLETESTLCSVQLGIEAGKSMEGLRVDQYHFESVLYTVVDTGAACSGAYFGTPSNLEGSARGKFDKAVVLAPASIMTGTFTAPAKQTLRGLTFEMNGGLVSSPVSINRLVGLIGATTLGNAPEKRGIGALFGCNSFTFHLLVDKSLADAISTGKTAPIGPIYGTGPDGAPTGNIDFDIDASQTGVTVEGGTTFTIPPGVGGLMIDPVYEPPASGDNGNWKINYWRLGDKARKFITGTITTSLPAVEATQTWNAAGVTFTGIKSNITDTASAAGSLLLDLQVGATSFFKVRKDGFVTIGNAAGAIAAATGYTGLRFFQGAATPMLGLSSSNILIDATAGLGWATDVNFNTPDLVIRRDAANILAQRNGTNAQAFKVYNTFTDASNYERAALIWSSNVCYLKNENAGTGAARPMIPVTGSLTVAALPAAATAGAGARAFVTDANATTFLTTVAGGGANKVPVVSDGTNWLIG